MGELFSGIFVIYILLSAALIPVIALDSYLKARDCKVANAVEQCWIVYSPEKPN